MYVYVYIYIHTYVYIHIHIHIYIYIYMYMCKNMLFMWVTQVSRSILSQCRSQDQRSNCRSRDPRSKRLFISRICFGSLRLFPLSNSHAQPPFPVVFLWTGLFSVHSAQNFSTLSSAIRFIIEEKRAKWLEAI